MTRLFSPTEAVERYFKERKHNISQKTYRNHKYALDIFTEFCDENNIDHINNIDAFDLEDFRLQREKENIQSTTLYNNLIVVRTFIRWCGQRDIVSPRLADGMTIPNREGEVRHTKLEAEKAEKILNHLSKYEYASFNHAVFTVLWDTGIRSGTLRALDLNDFHPKRNYIEVRNRPETDTRLKNGVQAERELNLHQDVTEIIEDYIDARRKDVPDEHGRDAIFTTAHGRPTQSTIQRTIYKLTQPCTYTDSCPHDREISSCEAQNSGSASKCPSNVSPHPVRRGSITKWLNDGHSKELLSDRMNVSPKILEKHYDARSKSDKRELRREAFDMN